MTYDGAVFFFIGAIIAAVFYFIRLGRLQRLKEEKTPTPPSFEPPLHKDIPYPKTALQKGKEGEEKIDKILRDLNLTFLSDVILEVGHKLTQIDHVVKHPGGLIVIETKNWSGHVTRKKNSVSIWQKRLRNGRIDELNNPLLQNAMHVNMVKKLTGLQKNIDSIIIFVGDVSFSPSLEAIPEIIHSLPVFREKLKYLTTKTNLPPEEERLLTEGWVTLTLNAQTNTQRHEEHLAQLKRKLNL